MLNCLLECISLCPNKCRPIKPLLNKSYLPIFMLTPRVICLIKQLSYTHHTGNFPLYKKFSSEGFSGNETQTGRKKHTPRTKSVTAFTFISEVQTIAPAFTMGLWGLSVQKKKKERKSREQLAWGRGSNCKQWLFCFVYRHIKQLESNTCGAHIDSRYRYLKQQQKPSRINV